MSLKKNLNFKEVFMPNTITSLNQNTYKVTTPNRNDFLIYTNPQKTDEKTNSISKVPFENLENLEILPLNNSIPGSPNIKFKPNINFSPTISVSGSSSLKSTVMKLVAGTVLGIVAWEYGPSIGITIGNLFKNAMYEQAKKFIPDMSFLNLSQYFSWNNITPLKLFNNMSLDDQSSLSKVNITSPNTFSLAFEDRLGGSSESTFDYIPRS